MSYMRGMTLSLFVGRVSIISGPNYSGKSIYAKQVNYEVRSFGLKSTLQDTFKILVATVLAVL